MIWEKCTGQPFEARIWSNHIGHTYSVILSIPPHRFPLSHGGGPLFSQREGGLGPRAMSDATAAPCGRAATPSRARGLSGSFSSRGRAPLIKPEGSPRHFFCSFPSFYRLCKQICKRFCFSTSVNVRCQHLIFLSI